MEDYLHGELSKESLGDVEDHLKECPPCEEERTIGVVLTNKVRSACCETAPEGLKLSIRETIERSS
jgi:anti-sigma factor (TIGR02949 family)